MEGSRESLNKTRKEFRRGLKLIVSFTRISSFRDDVTSPKMKFDKGAQVTKV